MPKAYSFSHFSNSDDVWELIEVEARDPEENEIRIDAKFFGLNFADVLTRLGLYKEAPKPPMISGYEVAGIVSAVGDSVKDYSVGDRVVALTRFGGYSQTVTVEAVNACKLPENVTMEDSLQLVVQGLTAYYCFEVATKIREGDKVLIHAGAGGVGSIAVQLAKLAGAFTVATCSEAKKAEFLQSIDCDLVVNYKEPSSWKSLAQATENQGYDIILDSIGGSTTGNNMDLLSAGGRLISIGVAAFLGEKGKSSFKLIKNAFTTRILHPFSLMIESKSYIAVNMLKISERRPDLLKLCIEDLLSMMSRGQLKTFVHKVYPHERIIEAHKDLQFRKTMGKCVIKW